jgi:hypothetical protein
MELFNEKEKKDGITTIKKPLALKTVYFIATETLLFR